MPLKTRVKVTKDVYDELKRLVEELGVESPNQVIRRLIELYRRGAPRGRDRGHPIDAVAGCVARVLRRGARGRTYVVECRDGRRAVVPEETIPRLVEMLGDAILVEE